MSQKRTNKFRKRGSLLEKIHTRKIKNLSRITESDCKYLDSMMSKYSKYEHSQARSTPVSMPEPDELEDGLLKLQGWYEEFTNR